MSSSNSSSNHWQIRGYSSNPNSKRACNSRLPGSRKPSTAKLDQLAKAQDVRNPKQNEIDHLDDKIADVQEQLSDLQQQLDDLEVN